MKLILVRHGEVMNKHNSDLTKRGRIQAVLLAKNLKKEKIDVIYSSDLKRSRQTANFIGKERNQKVIFTEFLREIPDEIIEKKKKDWKNKKIDMKRIKELKKFLSQLNKTHNKDIVLLVAHAKTNRLIVSILTKINPHNLLFFNQSHCNITIVEYGERYINKFRNTISGWKVILWNSTSHIPKNLVTGVNRLK